jgi:hypothetical protein
LSSASLADLGPALRGMLGTKTVVSPSSATTPKRLQAQLQYPPTYLLTACLSLLVVPVVVHTSSPLPSTATLLPLPPVSVLLLVVSSHLLPDLLGTLSLLLSVIKHRSWRLAGWYRPSNLYLSCQHQIVEGPYVSHHRPGLISAPSRHGLPLIALKHTIFKPQASPLIRHIASAARYNRRPGFRPFEQRFSISLVCLILLLVPACAFSQTEFGDVQPLLSRRLRVALPRIRRRQHERPAERTLVQRRGHASDGPRAPPRTAQLGANRREPGFKEPETVPRTFSPEPETYPQP